MRLIPTLPPIYLEFVETIETTANLKNTLLNEYYTESGKAESTESPSREFFLSFGRKGIENVCHNEQFKSGEISR